MATTLQHQALRIKNPLVRQQVIDILSSLKQCDLEDQSGFALNGMFVWAGTKEGHRYWANLHNLYGIVKNGESNEYISAYPITHDNSDVMVTKANYYIGMKVKRGKDWEWGDQDTINNKDGYGVIIAEPSTPGWVKVKWGNQTEAPGYRIGAGSKYDLYMVDDIPDPEVIDELPELSDDIWIHCKTEEEAKHLLQLAHDKGYRWSNNDSYLVHTNWEKYRTETVYNVVKGKFGQRCEKPVEKVYPASIIDKLFNNNTIQKTYEQERTERKERTDNNGTAAYIRPTHGTIAVAERRTGNAICYRGCQVLTRTGHSPNGTPAYGI